MITRRFKIVMAAIAIFHASMFGFMALGCGTPPSERVVQVQTLKVVGHTAEGAVALSAQLYAGGTIDAEKARKVLDIYNQKFQPAYRVAVNAAKSDLALASDDLVKISNELAALVASYQKKTP